MQSTHAHKQSKTAQRASWPMVMPSEYETSAAGQVGGNHRIFSQQRLASERKPVLDQAFTGLHPGTHSGAIDFRQTGLSSLSPYIRPVRDETYFRQTARLPEGAYANYVLDSQYPSSSSQGLASLPQVRAPASAQPRRDKTVLGRQYFPGAAQHSRGHTVDRSVQSAAISLSQPFVEPIQTQPATGTDSLLDNSQRSTQRPGRTHGPYNFSPESFVAPGPSSARRAYPADERPVNGPVRPTRADSVDEATCNTGWQGPCSYTWSSIPNSKKQRTKRNLQPLDTLNMALSKPSQRRPRRPFTDQNAREQTALTRQMRACIRCR